MVGGKILDKQTDNGITSILAVDGMDTLIVKAIIPNVYLDMINDGDPVWWQDGKVMLRLFGKEDVPFEKYGYSFGDIKYFYSKIKRNASR